MWDSWAAKAGGGGGGGGGGAGAGLLHWQRVRALMSGGRMVKVSTSSTPYLARTLTLTLTSP